MTRLRTVPAAALAAGLFLAAGATPAQPPAKPPAPPPADLAVVPKGAVAFVTVRVADLFDHPDLKPALEQLKKAPDVLDGVTEVFGVAPHEVERVTLFWPAVTGRGPGDPVAVVTTREAYNEARVLKALKADPVFGDGRGAGAGAERRARDAAIQNLKQIGDELRRFEDKSAWPKGAGPKLDPFFPPGGIDPKGNFPPPVGPPTLPKDPFPKPPGDDEPTVPISATLPGEPLFYELSHHPFGLLILADDRTLVFLPDTADREFVVLALVVQLVQKKSGGPLAGAVAAAGNHTLAAGVYLPPLLRGFDRGLPPDLAPYTALAAAKVAAVTADLGKTAKVTLTLTFEDAAAARRGAPVLEEGLKSLAAAAADEVVRMKAGSGPRKALAPLVEMVAAGVGKAAVKADGASAVATAEVEVGPAAVKAVAALVEAMAGRKTALARANNLKQIGLALHNYHDTHGRLPTDVCGPNGEPLLSWRVHLLPYLEQDALYRQFKMDEAWDGPTNKKLIDSMPKVFEADGRDVPKGQTVFQAFVTPDPRKAPPPRGPVGRTWLVAGGKDPTGLVRIQDGTSNTIGVVEARTPVVWSKPDDLPFGEKLPPLGADGADRFAALFLDGSVRTLPTNIKPELLRLFLDVQDGQVIPDLGDDRPGLFPARPAAEVKRYPVSPPK
ncbi:MAG: hypothetical protein C0501_01605 [Isosphaera sp.]|nr:hypothetical protein [Isosphaera sp.]